MYTIVFVLILVFSWLETSIGGDFAKVFASPAGDSPTAIAEGHGGGYLLVGENAHYGPGAENAWVLRLDGEGRILWEKTYGGSDRDIIWAVDRTSDGGYILAGTTKSGPGYWDAWLVKINDRGEVLWQKNYGLESFWGSDSSEEALAVKETSDGGFIVAGTTLAGWSEDIWVFKTDPSGNIEWSKVFEGSYGDVATAVAQTPAGDFIIVGSVESSPPFTDLLVLKIDSSGNLLWSKSYGGDNEEGALDVLVGSAGEILVLGYTGTDTFTRGGTDLWLLSLDGDGNINWQKSFGGDGNDKGYSIMEVPGGGYLLTGSTDSFGARVGDFWILRTDSAGNILWQKRFGTDTTEAQSGAFGVLTGDGLGVLGDTGFYNQNYSYNLLFLKLSDLSGNLNAKCNGWIHFLDTNSQYIGTTASPVDVSGSFNEHNATPDVADVSIQFSDVKSTVKEECLPQGGGSGGSGGGGASGGGGCTTASLAPAISYLLALFIILGRAFMRAKG